jgi:hypothetical protein
MDIFYVIVPSIAIILLILMLTYIGIKMTHNKVATASNAYPPQKSSCPDYWQVNQTNGYCMVPGNGKKNKGTLTNYAGVKGYDGATNSVNFTNAAWATSGGSITCGIKSWCDTNNIAWDGVSNYNACNSK